MRIRLMAFCLILLACAIPSFAQDTASLTGTVKDSSGAIVPNAKVTATNSAVGVTNTTVTNSDGAYLLAGLPPGTYDISVTAPGFKTYQAKGIVLDAAQKLRVDVSLAIGDVNTKVVVEGGDVAQVETQSSELANTITATQISQLELNGRNFAQLVTLVPGVTNGGSRGEAAVGVSGSVAFDINGGRSEYNNWELDGGSVMDSGSNTTLNLYPSLDSIKEVRVMTSNYGAQYGLNGSGTMEIITKSGTDKFHGDAYEYVRNEDFNANDFISNASGSPRAASKRNDFGYTLGGPFSIPGHYNRKKDKTFFFWSEEWRLQSNPTTFDVPVPSDAERGGDFTDICTNPSFNDFCPTNLPAGVTFATVPTTDPNAQAFLATIPHATETGTAAINDPGCTTPACYKTNTSAPEYWREELIRVDHNLSAKQRLMVRYTHDAWYIVNPGGGVFGTGSSAFQSYQNKELGPGTSTVIHLTSSFSASLLNEFVASYNADHIHFTFTGNNWQLPASFTMKGLFANGFGGEIPGISLSSADPTGGTQTDPYGGGFTNDPGPLPWNNSAPTYNYRDTVTKIIGNHNLQMGATFIAYQKNEPGVLEQQGVLAFQNTGGPTGFSTGNVISDLLLGDIANYSQTSSFPKYYNRYKILEPFFQDDWRVNSHLTLNLGLHVSLFGTYRDISHRSYNFEMRAFNKASAPQIDFDGSVTGQAGALIPGSGNPFDGIVQCGGPGGPFGPPSQLGDVTGSPLPGCMKGHLFNPAPRIGFAWDPWGNGKTAIRGGYGIFYEHQNGNEANSESLETTPPLACTSTQFFVSGYSNVGGGSGQNACNGIGVLFPVTFGGGPPSAIPTVAVWPYVQQWNLDVEHELFPKTILTVAYAGSKGTHLALQSDLNQVLPIAVSPYPKGQSISQNDCNTLNVTDTGGTLTAMGTIVGPSGTQNIPLTNQEAINLAVACGFSSSFPNVARPLPGWGDISLLQNVANSNYNALQMSLRRTTGPLILSMAYTYSHSLDDSSDRYDGSAVNSYNLRQNYASSNFDQRHVLNISYVYDLPNFKSNGWMHTFVGGWELSGITSWQTGTPFSVLPNAFGDAAGVANGFSLGTPIGSGAYDDIIGNPHAIPSGTSGLGPLLFNPGAFALPQGLTFGNEGRNFLNKPAYTNFDLGLIKHFPVRESASLEFRAEAFNVFNHTEWSGVTTDMSSANFLRPSGVYPARVLQLGMKFLF